MKSPNENNPKRDVKMATKIQVIMRRQNISQTQLAKKAGVTLVTVNQVIWGIKRIPWLRTFIAQELGFENWNELKAHKEVV